MGKARRRTPNERANKSTSISQTQGFGPLEQHYCFSPNGLKINSRPTCCLGRAQAACALCPSGADPVRSCCHGKAIGLGCVHRSPPPPPPRPHPSTPSSSSEPAFSLGRHGSSRQKQLSKAGKEAGTAILASGERDSNQRRISATGQTELPDAGAAWPGALSLQSPGPDLQAVCIRSQAPVLGKVEVGERTQAPKDWKAPESGQKPSASPLSPSNVTLLPAAPSAGRPSSAAEGVLQPRIWPLPSRAVAMLPEFNHPVSSEEPGVPEGGRTLPTESPCSGSEADPSAPLLFHALMCHLPPGQPWTQPLHRPCSALGDPRRPGPRAHAQSPPRHFRGVLRLSIRVHASFPRDLSGAQRQLAAGGNRGRRTGAVKLGAHLSTRP